MALRDRQRIPTPWLYVFLIVALLPVVMIGFRIAALAVDGSLLAPPGEWLNQHLHLRWIRYEDRDVVLYILLLPIAALMTALTRLTLGVRVLGFRAILLAIGLQEIGVLPCLLLIAVIAGTVVVVRPSMRRAGMPLFARVAVVLCIVAFTMLGGLLLGDWIDSVTLWSMAFFPVVILAMLAESVADTVARDGVAMALWRTATTILLAGLIAALSQWTLLRELMLSCPELLLLPLALIVFVSEFLDLRILEDFNPATLRSPHRPQPRGRVVIIRNRFPETAPRRVRPEVPKRYRRASVQLLVDQLRQRRYDVEVMEADCNLPARLRALASQSIKDEGGNLCVLNCSGGIQGPGLLAQVPALCEMLGLPFSGPGSQADAVLDDRRRQLASLRNEGLSVPESIGYAEAEERLLRNKGKVWVRPRYCADRGATPVSDPRRLERATRRVAARYGEVMLEAVPEGRAFTAVILQPEAPEYAVVLPVLQRGSVRRAFAPAQELNPDCATRVRSAALCAARSLGCRGLARVDLYCSDSAEVTIARVMPVEPLTARGACAAAARAAGLGLADVAELALRSAQGSPEAFTSHAPGSRSAKASTYPPKRYTPWRIFTSSATT